MSVFAICIPNRSAVLDDGRVCEITNFLDEDGDECDPEDAVSCVIRGGSDEWYLADTREFAHQKGH